LVQVDNEILEEDQVDEDIRYLVEVHVAVVHVAVHLKNSSYKV
jgi:hypothetical protein